MGASATRSKSGQERRKKEEIQPDLTEHQLEDVVVNKVLTTSVAAQLERLREVHGALLLIDLQSIALTFIRASMGRVTREKTGTYSYQELTSDKDDDAAIVVGGLGIKSGNLVLDLLERKSL